ncbi:MAG: DNA polymerase-1, partial [Planctomycetota bacterium]
ERKLQEVYEHIELPIIPIIKRMEDRGVLIDVDHFTKLSKKLHIKLDALEKVIYAEAGREFNIRSPKQLGEILFDELEISVKGLKKTATGARSTRESELNKLKGVHPIIDSLLQYREFHKIVSTYVDPLPKMVDSHNRIHTKLLQAGTSTGRFSSASPNMQNIPTRSDLGTEIRNGFIATPGFVFLSCDYSQIELRITAIMSADEYMLEVFSSGKDIHTAVAAKVFGVELDAVTKDMRRQAKVINFGIIYGMGVNALRENLGTSREEAQKFYNQYFEQFPTIQAYLESIKTRAIELGYTETLFGRRRYFPALQSTLPHIRAQAERMAVNAPIQGTATADIIKMALAYVDTIITEHGWQESVFPLLQIHDELMFEVREDMIDEVTPVIVTAMETAMIHSYFAYTPPVPLSVDANTGKRWGELKG